ncbi:hypothetical protein BN1864_LIB5394:02878 [Pseudomonas sp. 1 R 17]|nr:hypothetical protein BN1864_LIB5394:02878 [Pseudomonas sp. 1 R 17]
MPSESRQDQTLTFLPHRLNRQPIPGIADNSNTML